ncbi:MAG: 50S ribosomal protein L29 [Myxococcales bacterium]|nr:50S ribosomal protein L29 [Myxococcales bacterium]MCB9519913.1 50S ribosomal protein L29 [Myxococcales bacterium]MCB9533180.1 50S ribosomal protein L29 [Myxococcales bacterium]
MKAAELRDKSGAELKELATSLRDELFRARMQHMTGQLDQAGKLGALRKDIARVETILREQTQQG